jgi:hypothetical protein
MAESIDEDTFTLIHKAADILRDEGKREQSEALAAIARSLALLQRRIKALEPGLFRPTLESG